GVTEGCTTGNGHDVTTFAVQDMSDLHDDAPPNSGSPRLTPGLPILSFAADGFANEMQSRPGHPRSVGPMLRPVHRAGKAVFVAAAQQFWSWTDVKTRRFCRLPRQKP